MFKKAILLLVLNGLICETHGAEVPTAPTKIGIYDRMAAVNSPVGKEMRYEKHLVRAAAQQVLNDLDLDVIIEKGIMGQSKFTALDVTVPLIEAIIRLRKSAEL